MQIIRVPKLNENMETAMVGPWARSEGEHVAVGDILLQLVTDKATFELEAQAEGTLLLVAADEKSTVPVGYILGVIGNSDDVIPDVAGENETLMSGFELGTQVNFTPARKSKIKATPAARKAAKNKKISLEAVASSLSEQRVVTEEDVLNFNGGIK